jgi:diguanylate cyclase (GGDEF)-like protein
MVSGNKTEETYQSGAKAVPVYSCFIVDITSIMVSLKKSEQTNDYQRTITELSKELYFEYEIAKDTLTFTELFREVFGKDAVMPDFRSRLENTKLIHPEELPAVINIFNAMMSGKKQVRFEVRLFPKSGGPNSYICYASIIFDENRNPFKVVGKLALMNPMKKDEEAPVPLPELDALTGVCTKASAEAMILDEVSKQEPDGLSALMLVDVRNYKTINEIMKNINGENILTTLGNLLKSNFRSTDIIGRLGSSEFVVYLKGIRADKNAYNKAEQLCRAVEETHSYRYSKNGMSVSIGIAFLKGRQKEYPELLINANAALAMAKKVPNSSFEVFYEVPEI